MIILPLFGKDSSTQRASMFISFLITSLIWLIFFVVVIYVRPKKKEPEPEKFKTIQIHLADIPVPEQIVKEDSVIKPEELASDGGEIESVQSSLETESMPATEVIETPVVDIPEPAPEPQPIIEQKVETVKTEVPKQEPVITEPVKTEVKKPEPVKTETVKPEPVKTEVPKVENPKPIQQSTEKTETAVTQPVTPVVTKPVETKTQTPTKTPTKEEFDWSIFDDDEPLTPSTTTQKVVNTKNEVTGGTTAATSASTNTASSSSSTTNKSKNNTTSSGTSDALDKIAKAEATASSTGEKTSETPAKQATVNTGSISLNFDGGVRKASSTLSIPLSESAKKLIDQSVTLKISFTILPDGSVLRSTISVPSSMVSKVVRDEIIGAIAKWHFDSADNDTSASFNFNIVVK